MSVNSVSAAASAVDAKSVRPVDKRPDELSQLEQALKSGSLGDAQKAFSALSKAVEGRPKPGTPDNDGDDDSKKKAALEDLGKALKSGDLAGARKALTALKNGLQKLRRKHAHKAHHPDQQGAKVVADASTTDTRVSSPTTTTGIGVNVLA